VSYQTVRDGLLTVLQGITGFSSANVAYEDYQYLSAGLQRAIVVEYQRFSQDYNAMGGGQIWCDWRLRIQLFNELNDIANAQAEQDADRESILETVRKYPQLNGTTGVFLAVITSGEPEANPVQLGSARWLKEVLTIEIREDVSGTEVE